MKKEIKINSTTIGENSPVFIIAEAGVNHNGDFSIARKLVEQAKISGADCIKFQTFQAERVVTKNAPKAKYQLGTTDRAESQLKMLKKLELSKQHHIELKKIAEQLGLVFLSTPYNFEDVGLLEELKVSAYKIASGQIVEHAFLKKIAQTGKPIFLSTGMATMDEIQEALDTISAVGSDQVILLQCTTNYPSRVQDANVKVIPMFKKKFDCLSGYSDHTTGNEAICAAVALGATVIEKHFTIDKNFEGPDHSSSMTPDEFKVLVKNIRQVEQALGNGIKKPTQTENENKTGMRRSIVATSKIKKGDAINQNNISFKRPATGLSPKIYDELIGKKALIDIEQDTLIQKEMIQW